MAFKFVKKMFKCAAIVAIISTLTNTTSSFAFSGKQPDISSEKAKTFIETVAEMIDNTDFSKDEELSEMASTVIEAANNYAEDEESLGEFQKVSMVRVVDGDTIVVDIKGDACGNKDHEYTVRLIGINTPESVASEEYLEKKDTMNSEEGRAASEYTKSLLANYDYVYLQKDVSDEDYYGRLLRYVWIEIPTNEYDLGEISTDMLNGVLLKEGIAEVATYYPDVAYQEEFEQIAADTEYDNY